MTQTNPHLVQRLVGIQNSLMAEHEGSKGLPSAHAGDERESFLREFLQKVFPAHRRFSSGTITDSEGRLSGQIDIAIEYGFVPSFPMPSSTDRLLLAESVAMVIEVKSNLSSQWDQVVSTTKKVKGLNRHLGAIMTIGSGPSEQIPVIAVGYTGYETTKGIRDRLASTGEDSRPDAVLCIKSGCFVGLGIEAEGPMGLYALSLAINSSLNNLGFAVPNLLSYVKQDT